MLDDVGLESLRVRYGGKVGVVEWQGHQIVLRKPTRDDVRDFRRKGEDDPDRVDQLTQVMLVAFDGEVDLVAAKEKYLAFLSECPMFTDTPKCRAAVNVLGGIVEVEDSETLGKFVRVLNGRPRSIAKGSPTGSDTSAEGTPSATPVPSPQN